MQMTSVHAFEQDLMSGGVAGAVKHYQQQQHQQVQHIAAYFPAYAQPGFGSVPSSPMPESPPRATVGGPAAHQQKAAMFHPYSRANFSGARDSPPSSLSSSFGSIFPRRSPEVIYLRTSQADLNGYAACPTVACYEALYLLYSNAPKKETIIRYMQLACQDWIAGKELGMHDGSFEDGVGPWSRNPKVKASMRVDRDLEGNGLMLSSEELYQRVPASMYDKGAYNVMRGIRPALDRIVSVVRGLKINRARSFVLSRGGATISGCVRKKRDGSISFDIVDSHNCFLQSNPPPHGRSSAVWIQCYSIDDAVSFLEEIFRPSNNVDSVLEYARLIDATDVPEDQCYPDTTQLPEPMYSMTVYKPEFDTPEEASSVGSSASLSGQLYHNSRVRPPHSQ